MLNHPISRYCIKDVVQVTPDSMLAVAIGQMHASAISCIVVCEAHRPIGILTTRDLSPLLEDVSDWMQRPVRTAMSTSIVTCRVDIGFMEALEIMLEKGIRHLPVVDGDGLLVGLVTETDVINTIDSGDMLRALTVAEIMVANVITVPTDAPLSRVILVMQQEKVGSIIVIENECIAGILTERDIPRLLASETRGDTPIVQLMSRPVETVDIQSGAQTALLRMREKHVHHLVVSDADGKVCGIVTRSCFTRSLTQDLIQRLSRKNQQLQHSQAHVIEMENLYSAVTQLAPYGMLIQQEGRIVFANRTAILLLGAQEENDLTGLQAMVFIPDTGTWPDGASESASAPSMREQSLCRIDGSVFAAEVAGSQVTFRGAPSLMMVFGDISQRVEAEVHSRQSQNTEVLSTLIEGIAHNFNNILAGIMGKSYLAQMKAKSKETFRLLKDIDHLCHCEGEMIQQLLTFVSQGHQEFRNISLVPLIQDGIAIARVGMPEDIGVSEDITDAGMVIYGDEGQLQQVVMSLMSNARDAIMEQQSGRICVRLQVCKRDQLPPHLQTYIEVERLACLSVKDTGCGMREGDIDHIFDPFYTTKEVGEGTGLGLSMALGVIKSHGGALDVQSTPGEGTVFNVFLPLLERAVPDGEKQRQQIVQSASGGYVLVADDEAIIREIASQVLSDLGYEAIVAKDGQEALELFKAQSVDIVLVLSDVIMPHMDGVTAVRHMREIVPSLPAIFMTGYEKERVKDCENAYTGTMTKPFRIPELSRLIDELLSASADA